MKITRKQKKEMIQLARECEATNLIVVADSSGYTVTLARCRALGYRDFPLVTFSTQIDAQELAIVLKGALGFHSDVGFARTENEEGDNPVKAAELEVYKAVKYGHEIDMAIIDAASKIDPVTVAKMMAIAGYTREGGKWVKNNADT